MPGAGNLATSRASEVMDLGGEPANTTSLNWQNS